MEVDAEWGGGAGGVKGTYRLLTAATQPPLITLSVSHSALSLVTVNFSLLPRVPFKNRQQGVNCSDPFSPFRLLLPTVTAFICFISFTYNSNWWPPFFAVSCRGGVAKINANHTQNSVKLLQVERIFFSASIQFFLSRLATLLTHRNSLTDWTELNWLNDWLSWVTTDGRPKKNREKKSRATKTKICRTIFFSQDTNTFCSL